MAATIPIFDGENYEVWKVKMRTRFQSMDLWDTEEERPVGGTDKQNAEALTQIHQGVSDWVFRKIRGATTAKEAWDILKKESEKESEKKAKEAKDAKAPWRGVSDWIFKKIMKATKAKEAWDILQQKFQTVERRTRFSRNTLQRPITLPVPPNISKSKNNHLIVATLIATVTFTACITMPGGYINDNKDPNQGMAILTRKAAFKAFVITDVIALTLSVFAVLTYFYATVDNPTALRKQLYLAFCLTAYALIAMLLAFITGTYAVLAPSSLSISVCVIPSILLFIYLFCQCHFLPRANIEDIQV